MGQKQKPSEEDKRRKTAHKRYLWVNRNAARFWNAMHG
jgi:hypothetical protein